MLPSPVSPDLNPPDWVWLSFGGVVLLLLGLDLTVGQSKDGTVSLRGALLRTLAWVALAVGFGLGILFLAGPAKGLEFFSGYLIEYALSLDNIFLFVLIFQSFKIKPEQQHRLLFWGVLGAILLRGGMIFLGVHLISFFHSVLYFFGAYLVFTGWHMLRTSHEKKEVEEGLLVRLARRWLPLTRRAPQGRYLVREKGRLKFTTLALVLLVVEGTDLLFALDSIPAVFGVTTDAFIVFTSNIAAILGLRSLYFLLAGALRSLAYLHLGLSLVLIFIGAKMVLADLMPISTLLSLAVIGCILTVTLAASLLFPPPPHVRPKRTA